MSFGVCVHEEATHSIVFLDTLTDIWWRRTPAREQNPVRLDYDNGISVGAGHTSQRDRLYLGTNTSVTRIIMLLSRLDSTTPTDQYKFLDTLSAFDDAGDSRKICTNHKQPLSAQNKHHRCLSFLTHAVVRPLHACKPYRNHGSCGWTTISASAAVLAVNLTMRHTTQGLAERHAQAVTRLMHGDIDLGLALGCQNTKLASLTTWASTWYCW